jgi:hypothetical protein
MRKARRQFLHSIITALLLVLGLMTSTSAPQARSGGNAGVIPPNARPYGLTYGEWSAKWWQWAFSLPVDQNPFFDETGCLNGASGQSGPVWFLTGVINVSGSATRSCSVPVGRALFFPILNFECDNLCPPILPPATPAELRGFCAGAMNDAVNMVCEVDGVSIEGLNPVTTTPYRVTSPVFSVTLPDNSVQQFFACDVTPGTYSPFVSDGVFLMLAPLPKGQHTIHFHGELPSFGGFVLDITYNLTVR